MTRRKTIFRRISISITTGFLAVLILGYVYVEDVRAGLARIADDIACRFVEDLCSLK